MSDSGRTRIACVEDADDSGNAIENTAKYAASVVSPTKERPNTGRTRRERERRNSSSPITNAYTDSDSTAHPAIERRQSVRVKPGKERERSARDREIEGGRLSKKAIVTMRPPPPQRTATTPPVPSAPRYDAREVEASYYGISPMITPGHSRPRAQTSNPRPASYYGGGRPMAPPPQSNARFYQQQAPTPPPLPTSYPPRAWASTPHGSYPVASPVISQPPPQQEYFSRPLESRFGVNRPQSAIGHRQSRQLSYEYEEPSEPQPQRAITRHPSTKRQVTRTEMAPPARPQSARPSGPLFRPPPTPLIQRKSTPFEDEDFQGNDDLFHISPLARNTYHYQSPVAVTRQRRPSISDARSINYDLGTFRTEVAGRRSRRNSYYTDRSASSSSGYEDKIKNATDYQHGISGGNSLPLTAESLRKASKNGGSSQSTRSTRSRDESDYRKSATTRTTRSSAENEDFTIKVKGLATLEVGGARMQCQDGAEIKVSARGGSYRGGSDESSYMGQDDRRTKYERDRPATRTRSSSQAGSYSRAPPPMPFPPYDENRNPLAPLSSPYDHAPYPYAPPYSTSAYPTRDPAYSTRDWL